jgi:CMP-N-acetylneuraminic acid synthetase
VLSDWVFEAAHAFHIYGRRYMIEHGLPWRNIRNDPFLYEIPEIESMDIDTEEEFIMVEALYKSIKKGGS